MTLKERLSSRHNLLNAVRLVLASLVILGHSWPLTGTAEPINMSLAGVAVNGFFIASGYLIAESRTKTSFFPYIWRRLLRIYPAFLICLVLIAVVFAPLAALIEGHPVNPQSSVTFVLSNADLRIDQRGVEGTLETVPYPIAWNGSLWTLFYEAIAYVAIGVILSFSFVVRHSKWVLLGLTVAMVIIRPILLGPLGVENGFIVAAVRLGGYFLVGSLLWAWADIWRPQPWHIVVSAGVYSAMILSGYADLYGQLPLAMLILGIGSLPSLNWTTHTDLSYGVYIYAFPIQQLLVVLGSATWGIIPNTALTFFLVIPMAFLSWHLVEKPSLRAKGWLDSRQVRKDVRL